MIAQLEELRSSIHETAAVNELLECHHRLSELFAGDSAAGLPVRQLAAILQELHDLLVQKAIQFAIEELNQEGLPHPPCQYAWLVLGSGARGEQTVWTDQDNALVIEPNDMLTEEMLNYFERFAHIVVHNLAAAGYPLCSGYVMATNPRWRGTFKEWEQRVLEYLAYPDWGNVRFLLIAADMRPVAGDRQLGYALRDFIVDKISAQKFLLWMAADHGLHHRVALNWLSRIQPELEGDHKGEVNLKEGLYSPLVNAIRLWALSNRITEPSSFARIEKLLDKGCWSQELSKKISAALEASLTFRFRHPANYVRINNIEREEQECLLRALKETHRLQTLTAKHFVKPGG